MTGYSNAASEAEDLNLAGAINLLDFTSDVRAYVGKEARITIRSDGSAEWQQDLAVGDVDDDQELIWTNEEKQWSADVAVLADNQVQGAFSAGNVGSSLFATGAGDEGKSLGASYSHVTYDNTTLAYLAEGATVESDRSNPFNLAIRATSSENLMSLAPTAGKGGSYGLNGVFSLATIDNTTEASIDDEATVDTGHGRIEINAEDEVISWSLAGAVNKSESAAVGVGIALADVITDTQAFVGDNDASSDDGSTLALTKGSVTAGSLDITARTDGRIETIAVAGSYSSSSDPDRPTSRPRSNAVVEDTRTKWQKAKTWLKGKFSSGSSSTQTEPEYGYGVSGAVAWNEVALDTRAFAKDSQLTLTNGDLLISAINDTDIGAIGGSAALVRANAKSVERSGGFAGALAVNDLENETLAELLETDVGGVADAQLLALAGGEQLAIAIGAAINNSAEQDKATSAAGSVSVSKTDNRVAVTVDGSTLTGYDSGDLELIAYDRTRLGTGGGSLSVGGNKGFGAAITYSEIANTVEAVVSATSVTGFANAVLHAWSNARIAAGGAMGGFTNAEAEGTLGGAIVITEIDNTTKAVIDNGSDVALDSTLSVLARDTEPVADLDDRIDSHDDGAPNSVSLDYDGETFGEDTDPGSSILSVAGVLQAGANNIGLSFAYSDIDNAFTASIDEANVEVADGDVNVGAVSTARIKSFAVGVGVAKDEFAGGGSVTLNEIDNTVTATVDQAVVDSDGLTVGAEDASHIGSLAGQVTISTGSKAIGAAAAYNEIGNHVTASVDGVALGDQAFTLVDADNAATIRTLSATAGGAEDFAFNGAWSNAAIDNTTEAALLDAEAVEAANDADLGDVEVTATDASTIESLSGGAALATGGTGVGAALATNRIDNTTKAHVSGTTSTGLNVQNLLVQADSTSDIETLGIGLGGGDKVGVGGSVVTNFVDNDVEAYIDDGAQVMADDNVGVLAQSDDRITMAAGSAGIGLESAGVGASVSVNKISGDTKAYIAGPDTAVTAKGLDASNTLTIFPGELDEDVDLATSVDVDTYNSLALRDEMLTEEVTGLAVNASATQHVENIDVNVTGSAKFAGGVTVNVNRISGTTEAYIDNAATDGGGDVNVIAANHAYGNGFVGNLAVSGVSSIGAATDIHSIDRTTRAHVTDSDIEGVGAVTVKALATQGVSSAAIGGAVGIGNWSFAGTGSVAKFGGTTEAYLDSTDVTADSLAVVADSTNRMHLVGGAVSAAGGVGIGGTFTLGISDTTTRAYVQGEAGTPAQLALTGPLEINANTDNEFTSYAVGGALAGGAGYAGAAAVNLVTNTTEAWLRDTDVGSAGGVTVRAENRVDIENSAGALGIGLSGLGVGAGANVSILKGRVASEIDQSRVYSHGTVAVEAENTSLLDSESRMAGVGGTAGIGAAAVVALVGDDLKDAAADELDSGGDGTLSQLQTSIDGENLAAVDNDEALSADERSDMEATGDHEVSDVAYGTDSQGYRYQTTARITGTDTVIDADVDGKGIAISTVDTVQVDGLAMGVGASAGLGVGGGVGIVDLAGKSSAYVDEATLTTTGDVIIDAQGVVQDTDVTTYAGGAGAVGLGAAYIDITSTPQTAAYVGPQAKIEAAEHVQIGATSTSDVTAEGKGVVAGAVAVGVVIADVTDAGTTQAFIDGGALVGDGSDRVRSLDVTARSFQTLAADTGAAAGGIVAGQGSVATVEATPTVRAFVGDGAQIRVGDRVDFNAVGELDVDSTAKGITVAGAGAGVSLGTVDADPTIETAIGADAVIEAGGDILLTARQITTGLSSLATASFGGLIGAAASTATTLLSPTVGVAVGDGASLISRAGRIGLLADADNLADAFANGLVAGVAAWGSNTAEARIEEAKTTAGVGKSVSLTADSIQIEALAVNDVFADAVAGAGGVVVGASADASTRSDSETRAFIADNDATGGSNLLTTGGNLRILADELSIFNSQSDSTAGGVVGYSGAEIDDDIDALVVASIGRNVDIDSGGNVAVLARNHTDKAELTENSGRNASAGAGGVLGLSAGDGGTVVDNTTEAIIAGNSVGSNLAIHAAGSLAVSAESDVDSYSYGRLSAGGLIANADIEMQSTATSTTLASVGEYASLEAGDDIDVRARSNANVETKAHTSTYGVSASGAARAKTWIDNGNDAVVAANANLYAGRDIHVTAGAGLDGLRNDLRGKAEGRSWAKGLFPSGSVTGWSTIDNVNRVNLAAGSDLQAGQDVNLGSYAGSVSTDGYAKAKKTSYALFGIPINLYSNGSRKSIHNATTTVTVDGEVQSGINHHRWLDIAFDPDAPRKLGDISGNIGFDIAEVDLRADLDAEIADLDNQIAENNQNGASTLNVALENKQARLEAKRDALPYPAIIDRITLEDAAAQGGSVHVDGELSGSGALRTPGNDLRIEIINDSPAHLVTNHLEIPLSSQGQITLNGRRITNHPGMMIEYGPSALPEIFIAGYYNHEVDDPERYRHRDLPERQPG